MKKRDLKILARRLLELAEEDCHEKEYVITHSKHIKTVLAVRKEWREETLALAHKELDK